MPFVIYSFFLYIWLICFSGYGVFCANNNLSFPAIILIGDSTIDTGNNNHLPTIFRCNHPPYGRNYLNQKPTGRWSDGYMALDYVAQGLGLPSPLPYLDPKANGAAIVTGINLASGGAGMLDATSMAVGIATFSRQMNWYLQYKSKLSKVVGEAQAASIISRALHVISVASNDYLVNYYLPPGLPHPADASAFRSKILQQYETKLEILYQDGARIVVIVGIPPMGCLPYTMAFYNATDRYGCVGYMNDEAQSFNNELQGMMSNIKLPGMKLIYVDTYNTMLQILTNPQAYGFKVTTRGCCGHGIFSFGPTCSDLSLGTCHNTEDYVFFDAIHPTQRTGKVAADAFLLQLQKSFASQSD